MDNTYASTVKNGNPVVFPLLLVLIYYLPPTLLLTGVIPFTYRFYTLVTLAVVMIGVEYVRGFSLQDLGFRKDTLKPSLLWNGGLSLIFVAIMCTAYMAGWITTPTIPDWNLFFVFYVFISSPAQEFLFRSALFAEMRRAGITRLGWLILISSITYCFLHIFYRDLITLGVTLFMGIVWGLIYHKYPNFWGVALSHAVLGVVSILVGII
jgi:membrane protease YdiL (CAAX protease family)